MGKRKIWLVNKAIANSSNVSVLSGDLSSVSSYCGVYATLGFAWMLLSGLINVLEKVVGNFLNIVQPKLLRSKRTSFSAMSILPPCFSLESNKDV